MKKILALIVALLMVASLAACSDKDTGNEGSGIEKLIIDNTFTNNDIGTFTYDVGADGYIMITGYSAITATEHAIEIPEKIDDIAVTTIGDEAFKSCTTLTEIKIPSTVRYIGKLAFYGCNKLTKITLPETVESIDTAAFRECVALEEIVLSKNVKVLPAQLFWGCTALKTIDLHEGLTTIGEATFWDCDAITSVVIPVTVTEIGNTAFYGCDLLASVTVPESVTSVGTAAFAELGAEKVVFNAKADSYFDTYFEANFASIEKIYAHYEFKAS